jgi:tetratricopeptide (TPR) repeat protein
VAKREKNQKKSSPQPTPDLSKLPFGRFEDIKVWLLEIRNRWGWKGVVICLSLAILTLIWLNWESFYKLPGVSLVIERVTQQPLPTANPKKFSIAIAHLEDDPQKNFEALVYEALTEIAGQTIEILQFDRRISGNHEQARKLLQDSGAQVLIWGRVLSQSQAAVPKLHWTVINEVQDGKESSGRYPITAQDLDLPPVFWQDLQNILAILTLSEAAGYKKEDGHYLADKLKPFIDKVHGLLQDVIAKKSWPKDKQAELEFTLAGVLSTYAEQTGSNNALTEAISLYRAALKEHTLEKVPLLWARTQNNLGNALQRQGMFESDTHKLTEAVSSYRAVLKVRTLEREPLQWAATKNSLGTALSTLGELERDTKTLAEAVSAFRVALTVRTRKQAPLEWAMTQNNLGNAQNTLGEFTNNIKTLEKAVKAYRAALEERTRERVPLDWAKTQDNLGTALRSLGERESGIQTLEEAVNAYQGALEEFEKAKAQYYIEHTQCDLDQTKQLIQQRKSQQ